MSLTTITEDDTNNAGQTVASIISSAGGDRITDVDSGSLEGIALTATNDGNGHWEYSIDGGTNWTDVGVVSDASALLLRDTDLIRFVPDGLNATTADITFRAWDQATGNAGNKADTSVNGGVTSYSSATETADITVTGVNDAPTFDLGDGLTTFSVPGSTSTVFNQTLVQPDGKIVAVGTTVVGGQDDVVIVRYNADGSLDTTFGGGNGFFTSGLNSFEDSLSDVLLLADGSIVGVGGIGSGSAIDTLLVKLQPDGTLDTSFGTGGFAASSIVGFEQGISAVELPDGKFVVSGDTGNRFLAGAIQRKWLPRQHVWNERTSNP